MSGSAAQPGGPNAGAAGAPPPADFPTLFEQSFRRLWLLAAGIVRDRSLAEDVVQDAALIALEKWEQFTPGSSFTAWMGQMVRFVALNHVRREKRRRTAATDPVTIDATEAASAAPAATAALGTSVQHLSPDQLDFDDHLLRALQDVGDIPRACLLLRTLEDVPYSEIAALLDIPEGTAMSHVHRTRQFLRDRLRPAAGEMGWSRSEGVA